MKMSLYSIQLVLNATEQTINALESNLQWTKSSVIGELGQMKEAAADKCLEQMEGFSARVGAAVEDLKHIRSIMLSHKSFYDLMNE